MTVHILDVNDNSPVLVGDYSWKYLCTPRWEDQALVLASRDSDGPQHGGRLNFSLRSDTTVRSNWKLTPINGLSSPLTHSQTLYLLSNTRVECEVTNRPFHPRTTWPVSEYLFVCQSFQNYMSDKLHSLYSSLNVLKRCITAIALTYPVTLTSSNDVNVDKIRDLKWKGKKTAVESVQSDWDVIWNGYNA